MYTTITLPNGARVRVSPKVMQNIRKDRDAAARTARLFLGISPNKPSKRDGNGQWRNDNGRFVKAPSSHR